LGFSFRAGVAVVGKSTSGEEYLDAVLDERREDLVRVRVRVS